MPAQASAACTNAPSRAKPGRPPFVPTAELRALVRLLSGHGVTQPEICAMVAQVTGGTMSRPTLRKHFPVEIRVGRAEVALKVARALFELAMAGDLAAQIFWLKCQCGWSGRSTDEQAGPPGAPLPRIGVVTMY